MKVAKVTEIRKKKHERRILIAQGEHFFTKASVAQFAITNQELNVGDEVIIAGPSTGEERFIMNEFKVNGQNVSKATIGDKVTFTVPFRVRLSDKMFVVQKEN